MSEPSWLSGVGLAAGELLGVGERVVFSPTLVALLATGADVVELRPESLPAPMPDEVGPEFGAALDGGRPPLNPGQSRV